MTAFERKLRLLAMSLVLALTSSLLIVNLGFFLFCYQVGDVMDTEVNGFSLPLEHSFEVGEKLYFVAVCFCVSCYANNSPVLTVIYCK